MSEDFDKSDGEFNPILNALKGAQNKRQSTEERLKKELEEELEKKVSAYIDTLGLGEKISAEAIKGGTTITVDLDAHLENQEKICISNSDESTGFKFAKLWDEFYELMSESLTVPNKITCELKREETEGFTNENGFPVYAHSFEGNWICSKTVQRREVRRQRQYVMDGIKCGNAKNSPIHHLGFPNYTKLKISWRN